MEERILEVDEEINLPDGKMKFCIDVYRASILVLAGRNGIGKTTVFQHLKLVQTEWSKKYKIKVSFMGQDRIDTLPHFRSIDLIDTISSFLSSRFDLEHFKWLCDEFQFTPHLEKTIESLSGGENQMLKLIGCLALKSDVYFLDEPINHLDDSKKAAFMKILSSMKSEKKSFVIIEHRKDFITTMSDSVVVMSKNNEGYFLRKCDAGEEAQWMG